MEEITKPTKSAKAKPKPAKPLRRYQPPVAIPASLPDESQAGSEHNAESQRERTQVLSTHVSRSEAIKLLALFDNWAKAIKYKPFGANAATKTREQIASRSAGVKLGFSVTPETMAQLEQAAMERDRKKNFLATRAISAGLQEMTRDHLLAEYEGVRPSLSLVLLLAFSRGWQPVKS